MAETMLASNTQPASVVSPVLTNGCDLSKWQDDPNTVQEIDFKKMYAAGMRFVYIRATLGDSNDSNFIQAWKDAKAAGLLRGAYHAHLFNLGLSQCQRFISRIVDDPGEMPPAFDLERGGIGTAKKEAVIARMRDAIGFIDFELIRWNRPFGKKMILYTNPDIIVNFLGNNLPAWLLEHELWVAHYGVSSPSIGWQYRRWLFWQWSDRGPGLKYGVESKQLDMDVWNGDLASLIKFCGLDQPDTPPGEKTLEERVAFLEAWVKAHS